MSESNNKVQVLDVEEFANLSPEESYKKVIEVDREQTASRSQELAILPKEAQNQLVEASHYSRHLPNPITKPFMRKYILSKLEFPTKGSELAQSLTELNVRTQNLFNDAYMYKKAEIEVRKYEVEIAKLERKSKEGDDLEQAEALLDIELAKLEQNNKLVSLNQIKLNAMARYNEAMGWKGCVEEILKEMGKTSVDEVDFNQIRMDEMEAKIKKWGEMHAKGSLEITPSRLQAIESNSDAFVEGIQKGQAQIEEAQRQIEDAKRVLSMPRRN